MPVFPLASSAFLALLTFLASLASLNIKLLQARSLRLCERGPGERKPKGSRGAEDLPLLAKRQTVSEVGDAGDLTVTGETRDTFHISRFLEMISLGHPFVRWPRELDHAPMLRSAVGGCGPTGDGRLHGDRVCLELKAFILSDDIVREGDEPSPTLALHERIQTQLFVIHQNVSRKHPDEAVRLL